MSAIVGSRHSSPTSSVGSRGSGYVEQSDRLLRSECRRQGGKNCGHVECQIRARRSAVSTQPTFETPLLPVTAITAASDTLFDSPMTIWRFGGSRYQQLEASRASSSTTTTATTTVISSSSRVMRRSTRDSASTSGTYLNRDSSAAIRHNEDAATLAASSRMSGKSNNNSKLAFRSLWSKNASSTEEDEHDENAEEKGQLEERYGSKETSAIFDDAGEHMADCCCQEEVVVAEAAPSIVWLVLLAILSALRKAVYEAPRHALMWICSILCKTVRYAASSTTCFAYGCGTLFASATNSVASAVRLLLLRVVWVAVSTMRSTKSLLYSAVTLSTGSVSYCYNAFYTGAEFVTLFICDKIFTAAISIASGSRLLQTGFMQTVLWLGGTIWSYLISTASLILSTLCVISKTTRYISLWIYNGCSSFATASSTAIKRRSRSRRCRLPLLIMLLLLLLLLLLWYFLLSSRGDGHQISQSLRSASANAGKRAISAWSAGCLATQSAWYWLRLTATEFGATGFAYLQSATKHADPASPPPPPSSSEPPPPPSSPKSTESISIYYADLVDLRQEVAALRTSIAELKLTSIAAPPLCKQPEVSSNFATASSLDALIRDLADLKLRLTSAEAKILTASDSAKTATEVTSEVSRTIALISTEVRAQNEATTAALRLSAQRLNSGFAAFASQLRLRFRADAAVAAAAAATTAAVTAAAEAVRPQQHSSLELSAALTNAALAAASAEASVAELKSRLDQLDATVAGLSPAPLSPPTCCQDQQLTISTNSYTVSFPAEALPDFALHSAGGHAVSTRCTKHYNRRHSYLQLLGLPVIGFSNGPNTALQPGIQLGECWPFEGFPGHLVVRLAAPARVTAVTIYHVPRHLTFNNSAASAPKNFSIYGLRSESDTFSDERLLGTFAYDADTGPASQTFKLVPNEASAEVYPCVELVVHSNHGEEYTCLYRFRVHGSLV